jgi:hypothetical protein
MPGVREVIEAVGARLLYLPPYSPDFNPIEQLFANSKRYYERPPSARSKAFGTASQLCSTHSHLKNATTISAMLDMLHEKWKLLAAVRNIPREEPMSVIQWTALSFGGLLLLSQVQEPTQDSKFHLAEVSCKTFTEFSQQEQAIIMSWLQGYYLPEHAPAIIDLKKLLSDKAKLTEHCINQPEDDLMTAAEAVMRQ